jgi:hypothetical protein
MLHDFIVDYRDSIVERVRLRATRARTFALDLPRRHPGAVPPINPEHGASGEH